VVIRSRAEAPAEYVSFRGRLAALFCGLVVMAAATITYSKYVLPGLPRTFFEF
jgi:hypothetical protein